ncbi:hypothetical protein SAMN05421776_108213 [Nocardia farcinica]|uniref:Uncharacterized protein n=1 Tax=Nocardia farcinica TaxID=37329 RepID=A0A0H5NCM7_NOCFR|nr:hypothetical protein [Nocardia farcinica]AXK88822.1 hypothetical protein DXT66_27200 [Nocardia farcinica]MBA4858078.1 hypothetical protein [Nocardia farcinica]MBC9819391.1 hypothetical protein [Nocardia farcinica]PFX04063.1 hypothetical protein CJ469_01937 [Nocardia farcinica]PFX10221.1 hypothetical protein CJ468_01068 [Nocardia farcinica]
MDAAVTVIGLAVERLRGFFSPTAAVPPLGGGTDTVHLLAGSEVVVPYWLTGDPDLQDHSSCGGCGPYLWVRLARRWRTANWPHEAATGTGSGGAVTCGTSKAVTIEAGIARCHPLDGTAQEMEQRAAVLWDDSWRIDAALCAAMKDAERADVAVNTGLGAGVPDGPEGLVIVWVQTAHAQLAK